MTWIDGELGDFLTLKRGHDLPNGSRRPGDIPVVSSSGFTGWHDEAKAEPPGVVTGRYGTIGEVFYVDQPYWPLNTALYVIDFKGNDPQFIAYFLRHHLKNYQSEKSAVPGVDRKVLHKLPARCPDPQIQQAIVRTLSAYDDLIDVNQRRIVLLEENARQLYKEWFVRLRFPGHQHVQNICGVPKGWREGALGNFFDTTSGGTPSRTKPEYFDGEINWVKTQELDERPIFSTLERITEDALSNSSAKLFPKHTLLVSIYGGSNIGRTGILAKAAASNQACVALFPKEERYDWIFAQQWIQFNRPYIVGLAQGAAQTNINQATLAGLKIIWPDRAILDQFLEGMIPVYRMIETLCEQQIKLVYARDLLVPKFMRGSVTV